MKVEIQKKNISDSLKLFRPLQTILCTTKNEDGTDNVAPFAWCIPVSSKPAIVALALLNSPKKQKTLENILRTGEFVLNIPDASITFEVVETAKPVSGAEDKFEREGLHKSAAKKVNAVIVDECRAHIECKLENTLDTGNHTLVIGRVVCAYYDEEAFTASGEIVLDKYMPALYMGFDNGTASHMFCGVAAPQRATGKVKS